MMTWQIRVMLGAFGCDGVRVGPAAQNHAIALCTSQSLVPNGQTVLRIVCTRDDQTKSMLWHISKLVSLYILLCSFNGYRHSCAVLLLLLLLLLRSTLPE